MREKNKIKIVLSLLIAVAFLLPASSVMGSELKSIEKEKAGITTSNPNMKINAPELYGPDEVGILSLDDSGCFPIDVTAISVDGIDHESGDILATGTYPLDVTVCKTEWDPCMGIWSTVTVDDAQEGVDPAYTRLMVPLTISAMCDLDFVYFNFTLAAQPTSGWA
jgi:hypothetical protein